VRVNDVSELRAGSPELATRLPDLDISRAVLDPR